MRKMIEWKVDIPKSFEERNTMPIDRAKVEALRRIAEELNYLNDSLERVERKEVFRG